MSLVFENGKCSALLSIEANKGIRILHSVEPKGLVSGSGWIPPVPIRPIKKLEEYLVYPGFGFMCTF